MCGIWGLLGTELPAHRGELAMRTLRKRGPDSQATYVEPGLTLGHLRLAIIDLTETGAQPMHSACGRYVIVYNGEIYNFEAIRAEIGDAYPWRSHSDTEVVLAAFVRWGVKCLDRFHGMFAFALWDKHERRLWVGRDRLGVKPLYFHAGAHEFAFASRPRALFDLLPSLSRELDTQALRYYYEAGYVPAPHSIYGSVRKLEPGHYLDRRRSRHHQDALLESGADRNRRGSCRRPRGGSPRRVGRTRRPFRQATASQQCACGRFPLWRNR